MDRETHVNSKCLVIFSLILVGSPVSAQKTPKIGKAEAAAIAATPDQIAATAEIKNDEFDTTIRISTEPFYTEKQGIFKLVNGDKFIRATIDKKTGTTVFQIYIWTSYGGEWDRWTRMSYKVGDELKTTEGVEIDNSLTTCTRYGCFKRLDMAFQIPEKDLRIAAANAQAGTDRLWQFKLFSNKSGDGMSGIMETEIAGILLAADQQRAKMVLK